ncbi:DNA cytosine methyltransferase [Shewanella sp. 10N.286.52.B9]|uniref:DNA cytosine methyltransferase n=1 Tax=Shewanella sp. 10N.286.52.B9 TaxID=1880837 RepID=UPI000C860A69|nr:DNA cytosine methyltransferase [Shewanella sp. 10N.286.52.B9]PMG49625.1 DNA (cytosine-5-)-methyltransferase [Shewanella sp. 10N.286.52.B9]
METGEVLVIDLFAGPGGLGEGVSSVTHENGNLPFKIGVSVEKEPSAHKTLTTRAFYRKIQGTENGLASYNAYLNRELTREQLFDQYPQQAEEAQQETLLTPHALGDDNEEIHQRIRDLVQEHGDDRPRIVIGGPPCQAYSLAGRSRNAGIEGYSAEKDHRNFLYKEYLKVLSIAQPDVFIMENVRGILSAKIDGEVMFPRILKDLRAPGRITKIATPRYKVFSLVVDTENVNKPSYDDPTDFLIKAENYGVPQARHRVILLGVRTDVEGVPGTLVRREKQTTVEQVLSDLPKLRSGFSKRKDEVKEWERAVLKNGAQVKKLLRKQFKNAQDLDLKPFKKLNRSETQPVVHPEKMPAHLVQWYRNNTPACVLNHETRGHMESDLMRYSFSAAYTQLSGGTSPKARDFPEALAPKHENWKTGAHADRFRTQAANKCSTTVTSHISKDGHYFIHYDPKQCRSLTVREAARLQTFPDNYKFEGNRTQQYVQVGNAVPPYLAQQIGEVVMELLDH